MVGIIDSSEGRRRVAAKKGFAPWTRRFRISCNENTSVRLLGDPVIGYLVRGGEDSVMALSRTDHGGEGARSGNTLPLPGQRVKNVSDRRHAFPARPDTLRNDVPAWLARRLHVFACSADRPDDEISKPAFRRPREILRPCFPNPTRFTSTISPNMRSTATYSSESSSPKQ